MSNTTKGPFMQAMEKYTKSIKTFISAQGFGHYSKPSGGIPKTDLEQSVQTSLGKADSALQGFTESDPTVPAWAKASTKPSYTQDEVGDGTTYKRVSATEKNTWNSKGTYSKPSGGIPKTDLASAVQTSLEKADSALQSYTETDPTVPSWAKSSSKPTYTASEVGAVPIAHPFFTVPINHNMVYRGQNLGSTLTSAQHTALSSGNFTDLYLGDYWTKTVTIPSCTVKGGDNQNVTYPAQTNITVKATIADFDTFYGGYSNQAITNTHHAAVIVTGFNNLVWNKTNTTTGGYANSAIVSWLVYYALPQIENWFSSDKLLGHTQIVSNAVSGNSASSFYCFESLKASLLTETQVYGSKIWANSATANGGYEPGEAFKKLSIFNHISPNLLFGNKNIWLRDISGSDEVSCVNSIGAPYGNDTSSTSVAPAMFILLS